MSSKAMSLKGRINHYAKKNNIASFKLERRKAEGVPNRSEGEDGGSAGKGNHAGFWRVRPHEAECVHQAFPLRAAHALCPAALWVSKRRYQQQNAVAYLENRRA